MRVDEVAASEVNVEVNVFGSVTLVAYRPFALTGGQSVEAAAPESNLSNDEALRLFYRSICMQVSLWELTDGDGDIPITEEGMQRVPIDLLLIISQAIANDKDIRRQRSLQDTARAAFGRGEEQAQAIRLDGALGAEDDDPMSMAEFQSTGLAASNEASWDMCNKPRNAGGPLFSGADNAGDGHLEG